MLKVPNFLIALALVGVIDAISYMVVAPSIAFYVLEHGGTKNQYGIILSAFSFSSFCAKPFVGYFSDQYGFRVPYTICLLISALGGFVYLIASAFYGTTAVALMLIGRLLGGVGAASAALGFAYLAKAVPHDEQTKTNSLLSMTRIVGMSVGPGLNVFLSKIDLYWFGFHLDDLNSVGLVLVVANLLALLSILLLLEEPANDHTAPPDEDASLGGRCSRLQTIGRSLLCIEILVPLFAIFAFNANFQLVETGLAPAANHALGWSPIGVSGILGSVSIIIFLNMIIVFSLSARKVRDEHIFLFGATLNTFGYFLVWYYWRWEAQPWEFILPVLFSTSAFPYLAAPTRSIFTKAVDSNPLLDNYQGAMQAFLSMFASVAGFVTPGVVAAYVLRDPEQVESSVDHRELSEVALISPSMSIIALVGMVVVLRKNLLQEKAATTTALVDESSPLIEVKQQSFKKIKYTAQIEADRRRSTLMMGMVQSSCLDEFCMLEDSDKPDEEVDRASLNRLYRKSALFTRSN